MFGFTDDQYYGDEFASIPVYNKKLIPQKVLRPVALDHIPGESDRETIKQYCESCNKISDCIDNRSLVDETEEFWSDKFLTLEYKLSPVGSTYNVCMDYGDETGVCTGKRFYASIEKLIIELGVDEKDL